MRSTPTTPTAIPSRRSPARRRGSRSSSISVTARRPTAARRTRCRSGRDRAGTTCATSTPRTRTRWSTPSVERYWMEPSGGVDLYVGGVEHAVLHLLYARFWHKVLFDLGVVSTPEPFHRLFNQGYIQAPAFRDERGMTVEATEVEERDGKFVLRGRRGVPRVRQDGQEPEERRDARRHLPRLRRRHAAPLRDVHGAARREPPVEHSRHRRCPRVPAAPLAQRHRRGHRRTAGRRRARRRRRRSGSCTGRSPPCATTWPS